MNLARITKITAERLMEDAIGLEGINPAIFIVDHNTKMMIVEFYHHKEVEKQNAVVSALEEIISFHSARYYVVVIGATIVIRKVGFPPININEADDRMEAIIIYAESINTHHVRFLKPDRDDKGTILHIKEIQGYMIPAIPFIYEGMLKKKQTCH